MPPRTAAQEAARARRAATRAERAVDNTKYDEQVEQPVVKRLKNPGVAQKLKIRALENNWVEYMECLSDEGTKHELFPDTDTLNAFLLKGVPDIKAILAYMEFYSQTSQGVEHETPLLGSVLERWYTLAFAIKDATGQELPPDYSTTVKNYIRRECATLYSLSDSGKDKPWFEIDVYEAMATRIMDPSFVICSIKFRFQLLALLAILWAHSGRVCSCLPGSLEVEVNGEVIHLPYLKWKHLRLVLQKGIEGRNNIISLRVQSLDRKTDSSSDVEWTAVQATPLWCDAVSHILTMASMSGAFPAGWTLSSLYDPSSIPDGSHQHVINFQNENDPVFEGLYKQSWTQTQLRIYLHRAAADLNLSEDVLPHCLRRSGAIHLKIRGQDPEAIQQQLRHAHGGVTYEVYTGAVIVTDALAAVTGESSEIELALEFEPNRIRAVEPRVLSNRTLLSILQSERMQTRIAAHEDRLSQALQLHESKFEDLPPDVKHTLHVSYAAVYNTFGSLCGREHRRQRKEQARAGLEEGPTDAEAADDRFDADDQGAPAFVPTSEQASCSASGSAQFLADSILIAPHRALQIAFDNGEIDLDVARSMKPASRRFAMPTTNDDRPQGAMKDAFDDGLRAINQKLHLKHLDSVSETIESFLKVSDLSYRTAFRPGHCPVDDKCPFCVDHQLEPYPEKGTAWPWYSKTSTAVNNCGAKKALLAAKDDLLSFPETFLSPIDGKPTTAWQLGRTVKYNLKGKALPCFFCGLDDLGSSSLALEHYLEQHGLFAAAPCARTRIWDLNHIGFDAVWSAEDSKYVVDPLELIEHSRSIYRQRIIQPGTSISDYGISDALVVPVGVLDKDKNGLPADRKYEGVIGKFRAEVRSELCIICTNDPRLSAVDRVAASSMRHYIACAKKHLRRLIDVADCAHASSSTEDDYMWDGTSKRLLCPDPRCTRQFDTALELVQHLCAVHRCRLKGKWGTGLKKTHLSDHVPMSDVELVNFLNDFEPPTQRSSALPSLRLEEAAIVGGLRFGSDDDLSISVESTFSLNLDGIPSDIHLF